MEKSNKQIVTYVIQNFLNGTKYLYKKQKEHICEQLKQIYPESSEQEINDSVNHAIKVYFNLFKEEAKDE